MQLYQMDIPVLCRLLRERQLSARELTRQILCRIDEMEPIVGAYLIVTADTALEQADTVDQKRLRGEELSPLAGLPVALKDNIVTKGIPTTCASRLLEGFVPPYDATVVERLKAQGAVIVGKLNMDEFGMGSSCENSSFQKTRNPRNISRVPGGSSGGAAAALAAGETVLALGSDTGGSVRQPAAFCGVVGLKPTYGAISRYGLIAFASSLEQIGPMARSVEGVRLLFDGICGLDFRDAQSRDNKGSASLPLSGLRIGLPEEYFHDGEEYPSKQAVYNAARTLEQCGARLMRVRLPALRHALAAYYVLSSAEASSNLGRYDGVRFGKCVPGRDFTEQLENTRSTGFGFEVKRRILLGTHVLSAGGRKSREKYYERALCARHMLFADFASAFAQCHILLAPTAPGEAFGLGELQDPVQMFLQDRFTVPANLTGLPALSLPCGVGENGLPLGVQLIGPEMGEKLLFTVAGELEKLFGGPLPPAEAIGG